MALGGGRAGGVGGWRAGGREPDRAPRLHPEDGGLNLHVRARHAQIRTHAPRERSGRAPGSSGSCRRAGRQWSPRPAPGNPRRAAASAACAAHKVPQRQRSPLGHTCGTHHWRFGALKMEKMMDCTVLTTSITRRKRACGRACTRSSALHEMSDLLSARAAVPHKLRRETGRAVCNSPCGRDEEGEANEDGQHDERHR